MPPPTPPPPESNNAAKERWAAMDYDMKKTSFPPTNFEFSPKALAKPNVEFAKSRVQLVTIRDGPTSRSTENTE